jgi:hypothetical protein
LLVISWKAFLIVVFPLLALYSIYLLQNPDNREKPPILVKAMIRWQTKNRYTQEHSSRAGIEYRDRIIVRICKNDTTTSVFPDPVPPYPMSGALHLPAFPPGIQG